ncbi:MBL fold metallo-hydrolase [Fulvivirga kasyanovii]
MSAEQSILKYDSPYSVTSDVAGFKILFVNVYMIGEPVYGGDWVLIDAGLPGSADRIRKEAEKVFGSNNKPRAIVLTHGHFDHVGALPELLKHWNVPVYAHPLEMPYLKGKSHYPPPDPAVGGGAMAYMSWVYPTKPVNLGDKVLPFPANGIVPELPEWKIIHTPGHSPGHVSLFRERDCTLLAGDAFVTVNQNSVFSVISQKEEFHEPPAYFTIDWQAAKKSVQELARLNPKAIGTGHGLPVSGRKWQNRFARFAENFDNYIPEDGRYVKQPAHTDESGIVDMPEPTSYKRARLVAGIGLGVVAGAALAFISRKIKKGNSDIV